MGLSQRNVAKGARGGNSRNRRLSMEILEQRLALTWVGIPPVTVYPAFTAVPVTLNANHVASGTTTIATTEVDYYAFTATATGRYQISAITPTSNVDTILGVFSSAGNRLAYNDNISDTNRDSRVIMNLTAGTQYYLGVTNTISTSRGEYTWMIEGPTPTPPPPGDDAYENNDTQATAYDLGVVTTSRTISQLKLNDAADWYRFTTTAVGTSSSSVSISFQNSQGNLQLQLYSAGGTLLGTSASNANTETISLSGRGAGTYFVRVYGELNPNYTLTVTPGAAPTASNFHIQLSISGMTASQQQIFSQAAARWEEIIVGDLPNATYLGVAVDDLLIHARAVEIDGPGGILGQAAPDAFRPGTLLPYHGFMEFDSADLAVLEAEGDLLAVILHEMGHVIGIGTLWSPLGLLSGGTTNNPIFTGSQATAAYSQLFGVPAAGVPVENTGGPGTRNAHWRESIFVNELMTGYLGPGNVNPISVITVASLADIGYTVNMAQADPYTPRLSSVTYASAFTMSGPAMMELPVATEPKQNDWLPEVRTNSSFIVSANESSRRLLMTDTIAQTKQDAIDAAMAFHLPTGRPEVSEEFWLDGTEPELDSDDLFAWDDATARRWPLATSL